MAGLCGLVADSAQAVVWYQRAAGWHVDAQFSLGICYDHGIGGLAVDEVIALAWYQRAATAGHTNAQFTLGTCYARGHGTAANPAEAVGWYQKAAMGRHVEAQYSLGVCLEVASEFELIQHVRMCGSGGQQRLATQTHSIS